MCVDFIRGSGCLFLWGVNGRYLVLTIFICFLEEIIRRRLLFDGEGTGDERRINVLLKTFLKFCSSNETPEEM